MRKVRNAVFRNLKSINITMFIIAAFTFIFSIIDIYIFFNNGTSGVGIKSIGLLSSALAILPISWASCLILIIKTKKDHFAKVPCYIISALLVMAFILYYIMTSAEDNTVRNILIFSIVVLAVYPFIIAVLTLEGRVYNRVFATIFTSVLIGLSLVGAVVLFIIDSAISFSYLIPALNYIELLLIVLNYDLVKPVKKNQETKVTH